MLMVYHRHLTLHKKNTATSIVAVTPCTHINNALHKVMRVQHLPASQRTRTGTTFNHDSTKKANIHSKHKTFVCIVV